ncbi:MAG: IPT/TIG domain-containing protein [Candidatus Margulisbacteria bacterium]|nr:IPT/TIG domain-containing protein [Candidatus Margulisiibacteriota bacterium]
MFLWYNLRILLKRYLLIAFIMAFSFSCLFIDTADSASYKITSQSLNISAAAGSSASFGLRGLARDYYARQPASSGFFIGEGFLRTAYFSSPIFNPLVTAITPATGVGGSAVEITDLAGANFKAGASVKLSKSGQTDITGSNVTVVSSAKITCRFDLPSTAGGLWDVTVTNSDGGAGTLPSAFKISYTAPVVSSINPNKGNNNDANTKYKITGKYFRSGAEIYLSMTGATNISGDLVNILSSTEAECRFDLSGKTTGLWDVNVKNDDGQVGTLAQAFKLEAPTVELTKPVEISFPPNPDYPSLQATSIKYNLSRDSEIVIDIYNIRGEKVWTQVIPEGQSGGQVGDNQLIWNGITAFRSVASAGVYIIFINAKVNGETKLLSKQKIGIVK